MNSFVRWEERTTTDHPQLTYTIWTDCNSFQPSIFPISICILELFKTVTQESCWPLHFKVSPRNSNVYDLSFSLFCHQGWDSVHACETFSFLFDSASVVFLRNEKKAIHSKLRLLQCLSVPHFFLNAHNSPGVRKMTARAPEQTH